MCLPCAGPFGRCSSRVVAHVKGFLIGRPALYDQPAMGLDQYHAVYDLLARYQVPVIQDVDLGHLPPMMPLICGSYCPSGVQGETTSPSPCSAGDAEGSQLLPGALWEVHRQRISGPMPGTVSHEAYGVADCMKTAPRAIGPAGLL